MREIQTAPPGHIQRLAGRPGEALFDWAIVFKTCPVDETLRHRSSAMPGSSTPESVETTLYAMTLHVRAGERFDAEQIPALQAHVRQMIDEITADASPAAISAVRADGGAIRWQPVCAKAGRTSLPDR